MADIRSFFTPRTGNDKTEQTSQVPTRRSPRKNSSQITPAEKKNNKGSNDLVKAPKQKTKSTKGTDPKEEKKKKKKRLVIESDSDEEPLPPKLRKGKKSDKTEDDDEVVFVSATPSKTTPNKDVKQRLRGNSSSEKKKKKANSITPKKGVLVHTTVEEFFGSPTTKVSTKRKKSEEEKKTSATTDSNSLLVNNKDDVDVINIVDPPPKKLRVMVEDILPKKRKISSPSKKVASESPTEEVIMPTPPLSKKKGKTTCLASKLVLKVHESQNEQKREKDVETKQNDSKKKGIVKENEGQQSSKAENKMRDAVKDYIDQARQTEQKKDKQKTDSIKTLQKEKKENASHTRTSVATPPIDKSLTPVNTPSTPLEKRKSNYWAYKHREGPSALGSKELPVGAENCFEGLTFVITGVLDAFEREQVVDCIQRYGGKVTSAVSGRTSYVIVGNEPGQSKMDKAQKHNTTQIDENGFIELVQSRHSHGPSTPKVNKRDIKKSQDSSKSMTVTTPKSKNTTTPMTDNLSTNSSQSVSDFSESQDSFPKFSNSQKHTQSPYLSDVPKTQSPSPSSQKSVSEVACQLWVDKYKPKHMRNIIGQQGPKSNANKLKKWLLDWRENNNNTTGKKTNYMTGKEDGSIFKAALLSGPPGVGKTTSASLVCEDVGFSYIEMNASDTRGKKALDTIIKESLSNKTVNGMIKGDKETATNHVLIMDEVDGMAGNGDRGGMQELIQLIKKSKIPIICMCNDRNHAKVRSLANYCFDLRFYKPRVEQIKAFALSVASKERLTIPQQAMEQIVIGSNQDIRQVLHNLQMWTSTTSVINYDDAKSNAKNACKNIKLGPFDIVKQLFTHADSSKLSIKDKTDLFFMDYSFIPLFIQENYLAVNPSQGRHDARKTLELISETADAIADSNLVESLIRGKQSWSLLPLQGLYSTVIPSMKMSGYLGQRIEFPQWLGKNSSRNKHDRILQELKTHMALSSNCNKSDINMEYISVLKQRFTKPLLDSSLEPNTAAKEVISLMDSYNLTREDWDSVIDIGKWGKEPDVMSKIPSKVKSAFTRLYNKESHKTPYACHQATKKTKVKSTMSDDVLLGEDNEELEEDEDEKDDDITKDAMIKVKKEPVAGKSSKSKTAKCTKSTAGKSKSTVKEKKK